MNEGELWRNVRLPRTLPFRGSSSRPWSPSVLAILQMKAVSSNVQHLDISAVPDEVSQDVVCHVASALPSLTSLTASINPRKTPLLSLMPLVGRLTSLSLSFSPYASESPTCHDLRRLLPACVSLERLTMSKFLDDWALGELAAHSNLVSVEIHHCPRVTDEGVAALVSLCPDLESLKLLSCHNVSHEWLERWRQRHNVLTTAQHQLHARSPPPPPPAPSSNSPVHNWTSLPSPITPSSRNSSCSSLSSSSSFSSLTQLPLPNQKRMRNPLGSNRDPCGPPQLQLRSVWLSEVSRTDTYVAMLAAACPDLENLHVSSSSPILGTCVTSLLSTCPYLRHVMLPVCCSSSEHVTSLFLSPQVNVHSLEHLSLSLSYPCGPPCHVHPTNPPADSADHLPELPSGHYPLPASLTSVCLPHFSPVVTSRLRDVPSLRLAVLSACNLSGEGPRGSSCEHSAQSSVMASDSVSELALVPCIHCGHVLTVESLAGLVSAFPLLQRIVVGRNITLPPDVTPRLMTAEAKDVLGPIRLHFVDNVMADYSARIDACFSP